MVMATFCARCGSSTRAPLSAAPQSARPNSSASPASSFFDDDAPLLEPFFFDVSDFEKSVASRFMSSSPNKSGSEGARNLASPKASAAQTEADMDFASNCIASQCSLARGPAAVAPVPLASASAADSRPCSLAKTSIAAGSTWSSDMRCRTLPAGTPSLTILR